jgi:hypothetical protein
MGNRIDVILSRTTRRVKESSEGWRASEPASHSELLTWPVAMSTSGGFRLLGVGFGDGAEVQLAEGAVAESIPPVAPRGTPSGGCQPAESPQSCHSARSQPHTRSFRAERSAVAESIPDGVGSRGDAESAEKQSHGHSARSEAQSRNPHSKHGMTHRKAQKKPNADPAVRGVNGCTTA